MDGSRTRTFLPFPRHFLTRQAQTFAARGQKQNRLTQKSHFSSGILLLRIEVEDDNVLSKTMCAQGSVSACGLPLPTHSLGGLTVENTQHLKLG